MHSEIMPMVRPSALSRSRRVFAASSSAARMFVAAVLACLIAPPLHADTCSAQGGRFDWNAPAAWSCTGTNGSTYPGEKGIDIATMSGDLPVMANIVAPTPFPVTFSTGGQGAILALQPNGSLTLGEGSAIGALDSINIAGGALVIDTGALLQTQGRITLDSGTLTLNSDLELGVAEVPFAFNGGTISGPGNLTIASGMLFTGSVGAMTISGATINVLGSADYSATSPTTLSINSGGRIRVIGPGELSLSGTGTINADALSSIDVLTGANLYVYASPATINATVNNEGTVTSDAQLQLKGGGNHFGRFDAINAGSILFSGTHNFGGGTSFTNSTGAPAFQFDGAASQFNINTGFVNIPGLNWTGGTIGGGNTLSLLTSNIFDGSALAIGSGTTIHIPADVSGSLSLGTSTNVAGPGALELGLGATITVNGSPNVISAPVTIGSPTIVFGNFGAITFSGGGTINSGTFATTDLTNTFTFGGSFLVHAGTFRGPGAFCISPGGVFTIDNMNAPVAFVGTPGSSRLYNAGTIAFLPPATSVDVSGFAIRNDPSGTIDLQNDTSLTAATQAATILNDGGVFEKTAGSLTSSIQPAFTNGSTVIVKTGTLDFTNAYTQSGGTTILAGGTLAMLGGAGTFTLNSGNLEGTGTIQGKLATYPGGVVWPGLRSPLSPGSIRVTGDYVQSGALQVDLGGTVPGSGYDVLNVDGNATIGGALGITYISPFTTPNGQAYSVLTSANPVSGTFSVIHYPDLSPAWKTTYAANAVQIAMTQADLAIAHTAATSVANGQDIVYTINVTNNDPTLTATNLSISNMFTATFKAVSPSPCVTNDPNWITCSVASLAPGATYTITLTLTTSAVGSVSNLAGVNGAEFDPNTANNESTATVEVTPAVDLGVTLTDTPDPVLAGANVTYTIDVANGGLDPSATEDLLTLTLNDGTIVSVSSPFPCSNTTTKAICKMPAIPIGGNASMTIVATASTAAEMSLDATATDANDTNPANNAASQRTTITPAADLAVSQSASPTTLFNGKGSVVTVTVTNIGPSTATSIPLTDLFGGPVTISGATTADGTCLITGPKVSCTILSLASGASAVVTIDVLAAGSGTVTSSPAVPTSTPPLSQHDPIPANNSAVPVSITVNPASDLSIAVTPPASVYAGKDGAFSVAIYNAGPDAAASYDASLTITGGTIVSATGAMTCTTTATSAGCSGSSLAAGGTATVSIVATADAGASLAIEGTVAAASDPNATNNGPVSTSVAITASADVSASQSAPASVFHGQNATVTVIIGNTGPSTATNVTLTDAFTNGSFVSATASQGTCSGTTAVTCAIGTLASGASATVTLVFTATGASPLTNSASAVAAEHDPLPSNNTPAPLAVAVNPSADLSVTQTGPAALFDGQNAVLKIVVTNHGPSTATSVGISDSYSGGTFGSVSSTGGSSCSGTLPVACSISSLAAGATETITLTLTANVPGTMSNTVSATSPIFDGDPANNNSSATVKVTATADLAVSCTASPNPVDPARDTTITASIRNLGPSTAADVKFTDSFTGSTSASVATSQGTCSLSTTINCSIGTLAPGATAQVTIALRAGTVDIQNSASVSASETDPNGNNNSSTLTIALTRADVWVSKSGPVSASPGDSVTYTITIGNDGPSTSTAISLTDPTPAGLTAASVRGACVLLPCLISPLHAGANATISATYTVATGGDAPALITNTASVLADNDPSSSNDSSSVTTSLACKTQPPTPVSPLTGEVIGSPVTFTWTAVANATAYEVYVTQGTTLSLGTTSGTSLTGSVGNGPFSWYVVATTSDCGPMTSASVSPSACNRPDTPLASVVANAASGQTYSVQWAAVDGAGSYEVQEAGSVDFTDATTQAVTGTSLSFTHAATSTVRPFFYRVRSVASCDPQQKSDYSSIDRVVIAPIPTEILSPNANVPSGSTTIVIQDVPIAGIGDGNSYAFTAAVDKPWMSVSPSSGILPPSGIVLQISADPSSLSNGTSTGTLIVTIVAMTTSNARTSSTTSVSVPISISLVTPVTPASPSTTPANALVIPSVGHLDGIDSQWQSDVRVANPGFSRQQLLLTFVPASSDSSIVTTGMKQTTVTVDAGATVALDDIARNWFGIGSLGEAANGILMIRPLATAHSNASTPSVSGVVASSRTYSVSSSGTRGQYIPAIPFSSFIGTPASGQLPSVLSLQHIAQSDAFRTNVGIVEAAGAPAAVTLRVFDASGSNIQDVPLTISAYQQIQLNSFLASHGITLNDGRIEVQVTSGTGKVTAYASVVDNVTGDPLLVSGVPLNQTLASRYVLPGVAHFDNGQTCWRSDIRIFNGGAAPHAATLTLYPLGGGTPLTASETLNPGEVRLLDSAVQSLFGVTNVGGALHVTTASDSSLVVTGRTYNAVDGGGTYGQFIPAVTSADAVGSGERTLHILQVEESPRYRTNLGIAEVTGESATAEVTVYLPDSKVAPRVQIPLNAYEYRQFPIIQQLGLGNVYNARIGISVVGGNGRITAYGSIIDQQSQDPTYVPAQ